MSIPSKLPVNDSSIFEFKLHEYKYPDRDDGNDVYELNTSMLSEDDCHIFFSAEPCEELLIATALQYITFQHTNKTMNDQFHIQSLKCGDIEVTWCRFPKEFKDVCERAAKLFGMTMKRMSRIMVAGRAMKQTVLKIPSKEKILCFHGNYCIDARKISKERKNIAWFGNSLEELGVD